MKTTAETKDAPLGCCYNYVGCIYVCSSVQTDFSVHRDAGQFIASYICINKKYIFIFISKSFNKTSSKLFFKRPSAAFHTVCMQMHKQILKTLIWMNAFTTNSDPKMTADLLMALIQLKCYVQRNWETGRTQMQHLWDIDQLEKVYALCLKS